MDALTFYLFGGAAVLSALGVIFVSKPTRSLLLLIVTMASLSLIYLKLGASFVAMINLIVYAGAVLVLFLFVIMLQGVDARDIPLKQRFNPLFIPSVIILAILFLFGFLTILNKFPELQFQVVTGSVREIGKQIFTTYLLPFELVAILLLLAIFAAVALAKREENT